VIVAVDIDGTLCTTEGTNYAGAQPRADVIERVRALHSQGHTILIFTARGSGSGIDHRELTERQLAAWGVPYHSLNIGRKPVFDVLIDDRVIHVDDFMEHGL
jgi:hypothetical protein